MLSLWGYDECGQSVAAGNILSTMTDDGTLKTHERGRLPLASLLHLGWIVCRASQSRQRHVGAHTSGVQV